MEFTKPSFKALLESFKEVSSLLSIVLPYQSWWRIVHVGSLACGKQNDC